MHFIKNRGLKLKTINKIAISYFISLLGFSCVGTIWAIFLESYLHNISYVGFLSTFFTIISFVSYFVIIPIIEKYNKIKLFFLSLLIYVLSYLIFSFFSNIYTIFIIGIILAITASLRVTIFGIIVRDKSRDGSVSKNEGLVYSFLNAAWFIGPIIAGYIAQKYGFSYVFIFSSFIILISLLLFKDFNIKDGRVDKKIDYDILKVIKEFFKKKERIISYIISGGVNFWWALIYVYMPIYIINNNINNVVLGYFLSGVMVPLILSEYFFGKLAGKKGFKKLFFTGYFILGIFAIISFFISNIYLILFIMILASFGIAMVESTSEAYFFDIITKNQRDKFYGPYTTAIDMGHLTATFFSALILLFLPFRFIFVFFGLVMFIIAICSLKIKEVIEVRGV